MIKTRCYSDEWIPHAQVLDEILRDQKVKHPSIVVFHQQKEEFERLRDLPKKKIAQKKRMKQLKILMDDFIGPVVTQREQLFVELGIVSKKGARST